MPCCATINRKDIIRFPLGSREQELQALRQQGGERYVSPVQIMIVLNLNGTQHGLLEQIRAYYMEPTLKQRRLDIHV